MKKELKTENNSNKRTRVESGLDSVDDSSESKRVNTDSSELDRVDSHSDDVERDVYLHSQIREDILDILDEPDTLTECTPEIQNLDNIMKSFEEEILNGDPQTVLDLTSSDSVNSRPDIGYLLEASDDELGLPPSVSPPYDQVNGESALITEASEFAEMPNYDSFDFGMDPEAREGDNDGVSGNGDGDGDFVTVDGLFDYTEPADFSEFSWRQESLPAL
ncbi:uncharacterized protein LOC132633289 [Lycium barbarum]|uniref:uncharacterized protein LOC132633289 n=1 Tax=Lycium barbarum TaxID=112863 RepID=UPI00293E3C07|nr:uncharacterized protein LOC132633289 [Lycium barbarum]